MSTTTQEGIKIFLKYANRYINVKHITNIELVRDSLFKNEDKYDVRVTTTCNNKLVLHRGELVEVEKFVQALLEKMSEITFDRAEVIELITPVAEAVEEVVEVKKEKPVKRKRSVKADAK